MHTYSKVIRRFYSVIFYILMYDTAHGIGVSDNAVGVIAVVMIYEIKSNFCI